MLKHWVPATTVLFLLAGCGGGKRDTPSEAVRVTVAPTSAILHVTCGQKFNATVHNTANQGVSWTVSGAGCAGTSCGKVDATGLYFAPATVPNPPTVNVTATAAADTTKSAEATATIMAAIVVTVTPVSPNVHVGKTQQFSAAVRNAANSAVSWSVAGTGCSGAACGTVDNNGLYTAPAALPSPATVTVTATSVEDTTKSDAAAVMIVPAIVVRSGLAIPGVLPALSTKFAATTPDAHRESAATLDDSRSREFLKAGFTETRTCTNERAPCAIEF